MFIRLTKWECRRIVEILRTRNVLESHNSWADNLADKIEIEIVKQKDSGDMNDRNIR